MHGRNRGPTLQAFVASGYFVIYLFFCDENLIILVFLHLVFKRNTGSML